MITRRAGSARQRQRQKQKFLSGFLAIVMLLSMMAGTFSIPVYASEASAGLSDESSDIASSDASVSDILSMRASPNRKPGNGNGSSSGGGGSDSEEEEEESSNDSNFWDIIPSWISSALGRIADWLKPASNELYGDDTLKGILEVDKNVGEANTINNQTILDSALGAGGYSNTDLYSAISNISEIKSLIDEYMEVKYLTESDVEKIKLGMYLSQFIPPLNGNLLSVVNKLESAGDDTTPLSATVGNSGVTFEELCAFIRENNYATMLYKSSDGKKFEAATVQDLFYGKELKFYLKDTNYVPSNGEFSTEMVAKELKADDKISASTALAKVSNADKTVWAPFIDKNLRTNSSVINLVNLTLSRVDTYTCVLSDSLAVRAALTAVLNEYQREIKDFKVNNLKDALGGKELGMDAFGNIISYEDGNLILNAMMNPTLNAKMSGNVAEEKLNLHAYNIKSAYTSRTDGPPFSDGRAFIKKGAVAGTATTKWVSAFFDNKTVPSMTFDSYFLVTPKSNMSSIGTNKMPSKDVTPYKQWKDIVPWGMHDEPSEKWSMLYSLGSGNARVTQGYWVLKGDFGWYQVSLIPTVNIMEDAGGPFSFKDVNVNFIASDKKSYDVIAHTASKKGIFGLSNSDFPNKKISELSANEIMLATARYAQTGMLDGIELFNSNNLGNVKSKTQAFLSSGPDLLKEINEKTKGNAEIPEDYVCLPNSKVNDVGTGAATEATEGAEGEGEEGTGDTLNDSDPNKPDVSDIVMLGINIYDNADTVVNVQQSTKDKSEAAVNYTSLLLSMFKNTNQSNKRLSGMSELSQEDKAELTKMKGSGIIDMVFNMLTNPVTTILKYVAGFLQAVHTGLTSGSLESLFYISTEDVDAWLSTIPILLFSLTVVFFLAKTGWSSIRLVFDKGYSISNAGKIFAISAIALALPIVVLNLCVDGVGLLSDYGMQGAVMKYNTLYMETKLEESVKDEKDAVDKDVDQYFIENFKFASTGTVKIKEIDPNAVNVPGEQCTFKQFDVADISEKISSLEDAGDFGPKVYDKSRFTCALADDYSKSVFYYFLDYYINVYVREKGLSFGGNSVASSSGDWKQALQESLQESTGFFRSYYLNRGVIYGQTAGNVDSHVGLADVFGVGQLFYHDGSTPDQRGYYLPIEIMDSEYHNLNGFSSSGDNAYWEAIKQSKYMHNNKVAGILKSHGATEAQAEVLANKPVYNRYRMQVLRPEISPNKVVVNKKIPVAPVLISGQDVAIANNLAEDEMFALELKIWQLNKNIYKRFADYFAMEMKDVHTYTDVVQLAAMSTFEFNKMFGESGGFFDKVQVEPVTFDKAELDFDIVLRTIFNPEQRLTQKYDIMYALTLNGFGVVAAILLVVAEMFLMAYLVLRMAHLVQIYLMSVIVCSLAYGWRQNLQNKAWLGIVAQGAYFFLTHFILIFVLNALTLQPFPVTTLMSTIMALLLLVFSVFVAYLELSTIIFVFRHAKDMGGQVVADKVQAAIATIRGTMSGSLIAKKANVNADRVSAQHNDTNNDDSEISESENRLTKRAEASEKKSDRAAVDSNYSEERNGNGSGSEAGGSGSRAGGMDEEDKAEDLSREVKNAKKKL